MEENFGNMMDRLGLTLDEELFYANQAEIDVCDCCGNWTPITNWHDGSNYLQWTLVGQLLCRKCFC
jgi:hypothetical protein